MIYTFKYYHMPIFIERDEYEFLLRSVKFCEKIDRYSGLLNLDPEEVQSYKSETELFNHIFANKAAYGTLAESYIRYKIGNMQSLFYDLVSKCRNNRNYTGSIGADLGILTIEGGDNSINQTPSVTVSFDKEGFPVLNWVRGLLQHVEIWKDSGNGKGYQKLARSGNLIYTDRTPLPYHKCATWKYSVIYLYNGEMVGNWSDERQVIVYGHQTQ